MQTRRTCAAAWILLVAFSPAATAAESGLFAGVGVGYARVDGVANAEPNGPFTTPSLPPTLSIDSLPFDDEGTAAFGFIGYNVNAYLGIELSYWELSEFESVLSPNPDAPTLSADEWVLAGRFRYPLTESLNALWFAGVSRASFDVDGNITVLVVDPFGGIGVVNIPAASPDDETGFVWGAGFGWEFNEHLAVSVDYRQHRIEVADIETLNLTVTWSL